MENLKTQISNQFTTINAMLEANKQTRIIWYQKHLAYEQSLPKPNQQLIDQYTKLINS